MIYVHAHVITFDWMLHQLEFVAPDKEQTLAWLDMIDTDERNLCVVSVFLNGRQALAVHPYFGKAANIIKLPPMKMISFIDWRNSEIEKDDKDNTR